MFKKSTKVRLSPRLARTIGRPAYGNGLYKAKLVGLIVVVTGLFVVFSGNKLPNPPQSVSHAKAGAAGEVLGATSQAGIINYEVKGGNTLIGISRQFGVYWLTIVEENELQVPYNLTPGQVLRIPLPRN